MNANTIIGGCLDIFDQANKYKSKYSVSIDEVQNQIIKINNSEVLNSWYTDEYCINGDDHCSYKKTSMETFIKEPYP